MAELSDEVLAKIEELAVDNDDLRDEIIDYWSENEKLPTLVDGAIVVPVIKVVAEVPSKEVSDLIEKKAKKENNTPSNLKSPHFNYAGMTKEEFVHELEVHGIKLKVDTKTKGVGNDISGEDIARSESLLNLKKFGMFEMMQAKASEKDEAGNPTAISIEAKANIELLEKSYERVQYSLANPIYTTRQLRQLSLDAWYKAGVIGKEFYFKYSELE